jgi:hypothetical protein
MNGVRYHTDGRQIACKSFFGEYHFIKNTARCPDVNLVSVPVELMVFDQLFDKFRCAVTGSAPAIMSCMSTFGGSLCRKSEIRNFPIIIPTGIEN